MGLGKAGSSRVRVAQSLAGESVGHRPRLAPFLRLASSSGTIVGMAQSPGPTGRYRALALRLERQPGVRIHMRFLQIEDIGFRLPPSSRRHLAHWYAYSGSAVAKAFHEAGWKATNVNLVAEKLTFERDLGGIPR